MKNHKKDRKLSDKERYQLDEDYRNYKKLQARKTYYRKLGREIPEGRPGCLGDFPRGKSNIGYIYVLKNPAYPDYVKIGKTLNLGMRLSTYNTGSPYRDYSYAFVYETELAEAIEKHFNKKFKSNNEWYCMTTDDAISEINKFINN